MVLDMFNTNKNRVVLFVRVVRSNIEETTRGRLKRGRGSYTGNSCFGCHVDEHLLSWRVVKAYNWSSELELIGSSRIVAKMLSIYMFKLKQVISLGRRSN